MTSWILAVLALYFVQTLLAPIAGYALAGRKAVGLALGPRDTPPEMPMFSARLERALRNMSEALFVFLPIALLLEMKGLGEGLALTGAMVFFWARVAYVPAYVSGIPGLRSTMWTIGLVGIGLMVWALLVGSGPAV